MLLMPLLGIPESLKYGACRQYFMIDALGDATRGVD
jgi:hypothetical protein